MYHVIHRHAKANNKYMNDYDKDSIHRILNIGM